MSYSLEIDPETGDIVFSDDGSELSTATEPTPELYLAIQVPLGSSVADPDLGSRLQSLVTGDPVADPSASIEAAGREAIARLERFGLVTLERIAYDAGERELTIDTAELAGPLTLGV